MVLSALESYRKLYEDFLGIPVIKGIKSDAEKFAGAATTTTVEALMPDGKSLQAGTSHNLGQNFSKKEAFNISFSDKDGGTSYAWQTSFGLSTRAIGALVMVHGDDNGVVLPPRIAPTQVMLIPTDNSTEVSELCRNLEKELTNNSIRTKVLKDDSHTLGWRINECELTGIPLFAVIGQREVKSKEITFTQRFDGEKFTLSTGTSLDNILKSLENIHKGMFEKALKKQNELTFDVSDYEEFKKIMKTSKGFINAYWCESPECEKEIKDETKATTRCIRLEEVNSAKIKSGEGKCIRCQKACNHKWVFAQSY
jgi:prolyl-tRNA synthetase